VPPPLAGDEVHVWCIDLDELGTDLERFQGVLHAAELGRAATYRFAQHRRRFVVARGALRHMLGHYLGLAPANVPLQVTAYGKPYVASHGTQPPLQFNLAHAQAIAVLAITWQRRVGIDVEPVRDLPDSLSIAEHFFAAPEVQALQAMPAEWQAQAFFDCWTRKEAFVKALGEGLSYPLHRFVVSLQPHEPAALLHVDDDPQASRHWTMMALQPAAGYTAALVVEGAGWRPILLRFV
jgi:4'-phosphopantetheinyl transferase